jgi:hypothetical protein
VLLELLFYREDAGEIFLRNVGLSANYKALQPRRLYVYMLFNASIAFFVMTAKNLR